MSWTQHRATLDAMVLVYDKQARLVSKDTIMWRLAGKVLSFLTRGKFDSKRFMESFATTIGHKIYVPPSWTNEQVMRCLAHECRHVKQFRACGFGIHPVVGIPLMAFLFGLFVLPVGLAIGRVLLELDADIAKWKEITRRADMTSEQKVRTIVNSSLSRSLVLAGPEYMYAMPVSWCKKLYSRAAEKVILA